MIAPGKGGPGGDVPMTADPTPDHGVECGDQDVLHFMRTASSRDFGKVVLDSQLSRHPSLALLRRQQD